MKIKKIIICAFIAALVLMQGCASDTESTDNTGTTTTTAANSRENVEEIAETPINVLDTIPSEDFEDYVFTFIKPENDNWATGELIVAEEVGEVILDAMYHRNNKIEEKYNITLKEVRTNDAAGSFRTSVNAGDESYDAIYARLVSLGNLSAGGILYNLIDMPNMDLSKPWWDSSIIKELSITNKLYMITGDMNLHYNDATWILMFNKNMIQDFELDDPYELVLENKWTLDKFNEMCSAVSEDLNGNGEVDSDDRFGFLSHTSTYNPFIFGSNERFFTKDNDDLPVFALSNQSFATKFIKVSEMLSSKAVMGIAVRDAYFDVAGTDGSWQNVFFHGRALFFGEVLGTLHKSNMKNMDANFGLLPMPKYDTNQPDYICTVLETSLALGIPANAPNPERTGLILEAMAAESSSSVIPAYYDVALQFKLTRDEESVKMLDIIRANRIYDVGGVYGIGSVASDISSRINTNDTNIASYIERTATRAQSSIDRLVDAYR